MATADARADTRRLILDWETLPSNHPARGYVLRQGTRTLIDEERWGVLDSLLLDDETGLRFLAAIVEARLIFGLINDLFYAVPRIRDDPIRTTLRVLADAFRLSALRAGR